MLYVTALKENLLLENIPNFTTYASTFSGIYLPGQSIIFLFMEEKPSECPMKG